jgi:hypothetical protein
MTSNYYELCTCVLATVPPLKCSLIPDRLAKCNCVNLQGKSTRAQENRPTWLQVEKIRTSVVRLQNLLTQNEDEPINFSTYLV